MTLPQDRERCYIVILNYNGWKDTIECLETVLKSQYEDFRVIVIDNCSSNQSVQNIEAWAQGGIKAYCKKEREIEKLFYPVIDKPIKIEQYVPGAQSEWRGKLMLATAPRNLGFAGGMNFGIKIALQDEACGYIWCLNNDTVVDKDVMAGMVTSLNENKQAGICSSYTRSYDHADKSIHDPGIDRIRINKWLGTNVIFQDNGHASRQMKQCDYDGASFMVTRRFVETVGFMETRYFLFMEEPDWTIRGRRAGFSLVFYPSGLVFHKGGQSMGGHKSYFSDYYMIRSRILFTRKIYPYCLPTVYLGLFVSIMNRIKRGQMNRVGMILKLMFNPWKMLNNNQGGKK